MAHDVELTPSSLGSPGATVPRCSLRTARHVAKVPFHQRRTERACVECGTAFLPPREASTACSAPCRQLNREKRGERAKLDYQPKLCKECHGLFKPIRHDQVFCSKECRFEEHNRELSRAKLIYRELYHWTAASGRKGTGTFLSQVSRAVRRWIDEDRRAGRQAPPMPYGDSLDRQLKDRGALIVERDRLLGEIPA